MNKTEKLQWIISEAMEEGKLHVCLMRLALSKPQLGLSKSLLSLYILTWRVGYRGSTRGLLGHYMTQCV